MIITVDTDKDSKERLLQVARFLQELAGQRPSSPVEPLQVSTPAPEPTAEVFNMFADPEPAPEPQPAPRVRDDDTISAVSQLLKDNDDDPKVTPY